MASAKRKAVGRRRGGCRGKPERCRKVQLLEGDCVEVLGELEPESVDAIVTDPPYGLEFMGKGWDRFRVDDPGTARHRGLYSGSHGQVPASNGDRVHPARGGVVYGGGKRPTTCRCVGCGKRDQFRNSHKPCGAGEWRKELIDPHSAPPTSLAFQEWCRTWALEAKRVLKPGGHLLAFGGTRTYHRLACAIEDAGFEVRDSIIWLYGSGFPKSLNVQKAIAKASPEVVGWGGWGTALKPAHEPIVVARKPLVGTVAENVLEHGTGGINVDGCRIGCETEADRASATSKGPATNKGRWPANVVLGEEAAAELDAQSSERPGGGSIRNGKDMGYHGGDAVREREPMGDSGGASRFFYCPKTSRAEREAGLDGFDVKTADPYGQHRGRRMKDKSRIDGKPAKEGRNNHPTVKPIDLMRWLVRVVTPYGGTCLDPFLGSGSTGCAAALEGFDFIGIEKDAEYMAIAKPRIRFWARHQGQEVKETLSRRSKGQRSQGST